MSPSTSNNQGWLALSTSSDDETYDGERPKWESDSRRPKWAKKGLRLPRLRKVVVGLVLIDVFIVAVLVHLFNPLITLLRRNEELFGARLTLPIDQKPQPATGHLDTNSIPRIFHQTSATEVIPDKWKESVEGCKKIYSEFEYKVCLIEDAVP